MRVMAAGLAAALLGGAQGPSAPLTSRPQAGRLEGNVILTRELSARRPRFRLYSEHGGQATPAAATADTVEYGNVVIYLDSVPWSGAAAPAGTMLRMRQVNEAFTPHVLPVLVGSTVQFPNDDPFFHNVFSLSSTRTFDLGRFPQGSSKGVTFERPGLVQVFCHIHSDMNGVILVRDNPYFVVPDDRGRFAIDGVPAGDYQAVAWHERIRPVSTTVRIRDGETTGIEFQIPLTP